MFSYENKIRDSFIVLKKTEKERDEGKNGNIQVISDGISNKN